MWKGAAHVGINGWGVSCGWCNKSKVENVNIPCDGEGIGWNKVHGMGMIGWW
jgi:hypothetical protein